jgi:DNA polymerase IV (DinB-like DNA polymerase)
LDSLVEKANELCDDLASRILNEGFTFKTVGVMAVMTDLRNYSRSKSLDSPSNSVDAMKKIVKELFAKFLDESELDIRRVGVKVSSLARVEKNQAKITRFFESA